MRPRRRSQTTTCAGSCLPWLLQFAIAVLARARGIGNFRPGMIVSTSTVVSTWSRRHLLIFGWGTGHAFGVAGGDLDARVDRRRGRVVHRDLSSDRCCASTPRRPSLAIWKQVSRSVPPGVEFGLVAVYLFVVYTVSRPFGAEAQAGFGIGMRVIQAGFMPVVALGFAVAPVAGQNVGAGLASRVRDTYRAAAAMAMGVMLVVAVVCQVAGRQLMGIFSSDPGVIAVGNEYLHIMAWTFVAWGWSSCRRACSRPSATCPRSSPRSCACSSSRAGLRPREATGLQARVGVVPVGGVDSRAGRAEPGAAAARLQAPVRGGARHAGRLTTHRHDRSPTDRVLDSAAKGGLTLGSVAARWPAEVCRRRRRPLKIEGVLL
jgi:hypothetical protein